MEGFLHKLLGSEAMNAFLQGVARGLLVRDSLILWTSRSVGIFSNFSDPGFVFTGSIWHGRGSRIGRQVYEIGVDCHQNGSRLHSAGREKLVEQKNARVSPAGCALSRRFAARPAGPLASRSTKGESGHQGCRVTKGDVATE